MKAGYTNRYVVMNTDVDCVEIFNDHTSNTYAELKMLNYKDIKEDKKPDAVGVWKIKQHKNETT